MAHPRDLPSISDLLSEKWAQALIEEKGRVLMTALMRHMVDAERLKLLQSPDQWSAPDWSELINDYVTDQQTSKTKRAVNATGILLHTGLGRAVLPEKSVEALAKNLRGATQVEIDPVTGKRSQRDAAVARILCDLFEAEDALVVNNNAAATLLVLHALSAEKEVVISRGELVEIGGSFRLPEIMIQSRVQLREVGATNKSRLSDFESAITSSTGLIMKAHTSNYKIMGFTQEVDIGELVQLGQKHRIPVVHDIGSGALLDVQQFNLPPEPMARESLKAGADLVFFSGDKLLGGPQAGIIIGKKKYVDICRKNPLARALRIDKTTLILLESVLELYRENRFNEIPLYERLSLSQKQLQDQAQAIVDKIATPWGVSIEESFGEMGSGSMPTTQIPSVRIVLQHPERSAEDIANVLRKNEIPIYGHIHQGKYGLNVLSILPIDHEVIIEALNSSV